jgi:DNA mismatch endonuclease (patch repair protein)
MDLISKEKRSEIMAKVHSKGNKSTEVRFESLLRSSKIHGWRKHYKVIGKPDFAFPALKLAVFLDGAFWHGHPRRKLPKTNKAFWTAKIAQNKSRDKKVASVLRIQGWSVLRIWDFDLQQAPEKCIIRLKRLITMRMRKCDKMS